MWYSAVETKGPSHVPEGMAFNLPWEMTVVCCAAVLQRGDCLLNSQTVSFITVFFQSSVILRRVFGDFSINLETLGKPHARHPCWKTWPEHQLSHCCGSSFMSVIHSTWLPSAQLGHDLCHFVKISTRNTPIPLSSSSSLWSPLLPNSHQVPLLQEVPKCGPPWPYEETVLDGLNTEQRGC